MKSHLRQWSKSLPNIEQKAVAYRLQDDFPSKTMGMDSLNFYRRCKKCNNSAQPQPCCEYGIEPSQSSEWSMTGLVVHLSNYAACDILEYSMQHLGMANSCDLQNLRLRKWSQYHMIRDTLKWKMTHHVLWKEVPKLHILDRAVDALHDVKNFQYHYWGCRRVIVKHPKKFEDCTVR